jgi:hypothetical protein
MKTLQQRLQSRISTRRNEIREIEELISRYKELGFSYIAANFRQDLKTLVADQKLDKQLYGHCMTQHAVMVDLLKALMNESADSFIVLDDVERVDDIS